MKIGKLEMAPLVCYSHSKSSNMTPESSTIPDWAQQERQGDLFWFQKNRELLWTVASLAFDDLGRGAIVVDTTLQPIPGRGHPLAYFSQERIEAQNDEDTERMVSDYDPETEIVLLLLKPGDRSSTYRVQVIAREGSEEDLHRWPTLDQPQDPEPEPELEIPSIETLMQWEAEGGCEAACPHACWVEPDGHCEHGNPSWLLKLGLI
jgi:hypothetical protein